ncbi:hypothetical protein ACROYT_G043412 [Oculina patagonica]
MTMVCPCLKGSVLDTFKHTNIYWGEFLGIKVMSLLIRWCFGSKVELQTSRSLTSTEQATHHDTEKHIPHCPTRCVGPVARRGEITKRRERGGLAVSSACGRLLWSHQ